MQPRNKQVSGDAETRLGVFEHLFQVHILKGKSTVTAHFDLVSEAYKCLENKEKMMYDFSNAFGSLQPQLLTKKLEKYGLQDEALAWDKFIFDGQNTNCSTEITRQERYIV